MIEEHIQGIIWTSILEYLFDDETDPLLLQVIYKLVHHALNVLRQRSDILLSVAWKSVASWLP